MTRKGYKPKNKRTKLPLTVADQRNLVDKAEGAMKALLFLFLSTGMHPKVLSEPKRYGLTWDQNFVSWSRTKNLKTCTFGWSKAMKTPGMLDELWALKGKTRQWYFILMKNLGKANGVPSLCPLQLRHNYFINRGRIGHNVMDISHSSGTGLDVIYNHYTVGMNDGKSLTDEDKKWLQWLMEG
jgi:hypothetical protein